MPTYQDHFDLLKRTARAQRKTPSASANPRPSSPRPQSDMDKLLREFKPDAADAGRRGITGEGTNTGPVMQDPSTYLSDLLEQKTLGEPLQASKLAIMLAGLMGIKPEESETFAPPPTPKLAEARHPVNIPAGPAFGY